MIDLQLEAAANPRGGGPDLLAPDYDGPAHLVLGPVELAVRTILSQFACDEGILGAATDRASRDAMPLPRELVDRIRYVFATPGETDPA